MIFWEKKLPLYTHKTAYYSLDAEYCIDGFLVNPDFLQGESFDPYWNQQDIQGWTLHKNSNNFISKSVKFIYVANSNDFPKNPPNGRRPGIAANTIYIAVFEATSSGLQRLHNQFDFVYEAAEYLVKQNGNHVGPFA